MGHGEHHKPEFTPQERILWQRPPSIQNECTDYHIQYEKCVKDYVSNGTWPFSMVWGLHWADRWICPHEKHEVVHCEEERMRKTFEKNKDVIASLN